MSAMPYEEAGWDGDGYAVSPQPVSPPVSPGVSPPVSPAASPGVSRPSFPPGGGEDSDDDGDWEAGGGRPSLDWIGTSSWTAEADAGPDSRRGAPGPPPGLRLRGHLEALAGSDLVGGGPGGLIAELASPRPETMRQHWQYVTSHPARPGDLWAGRAFVAGHLMVTGPAKLTGKALTTIGTALAFTGTRVDWAGDRFARIATGIAVAVALAVIFLAFA